jgi:hypothetical protein
MTIRTNLGLDGSILKGSLAGLAQIPIAVAVEPGPLANIAAMPVGSLLNGQSISWPTNGSSLSYEVEDNEGNVEPSDSSGITSPPSATAALGPEGLIEDQGSASHRPIEPITNDDGEADAKTNEKDECCGEPDGFDPRPGDESAVEHIRLQMWDRRPVRGTPFRVKVELRLGRRRHTHFINFTESRKWYGKRQDLLPENQAFYDWYRGTVAPHEKSYDGDPAYRPRIGHMISRPKHGEAQVQIPRASGILTWEGGQPTVMLMINDFIWTLVLQKSKHSPGPKTPRWYAYYQPGHEEEEDEEYC